MSGQDYSKFYSESAMWQRISERASKVGKDVILNVLILHYALDLGKADDVQVLGIKNAIGFFISPKRSIPDLLPLGFIEEAMVLSTTVSKFECCKYPEVVASAKSKLNELF